VNKLVDLEKRDNTFSTTLESKFREMHSKLDAVERDQAQTLTRLLQGLDNLRSSVDVNKIEELKKDLRIALASLGNIERKINTIETHVDGTSKKAADLHDSYDDRSNEMIERVERSSSWGFWSFFIIFQILFWGAFLWWKKSHDNKSKKFL